MNKETYYLKTDRQTIDFNPKVITEMYDKGYVLTRLGKGIMDQTRSLRIDLSKFELTSENRRILRKVEGLELKVENLPLEDYSWEIHKMGKDFYSTKFGDDTMSAVKIKEMFQDEDKSNMTTALSYELRAVSDEQNTKSEYLNSNEISNLKSKDPKNEATLGFRVSSLEFNKVGYCLCYANDEIVHYAYPFYKLEIFNLKFKNVGLAMMTRAILWAKDAGKKYIYLGSVVTPESKYKLQFEGLEWFDLDKKGWSEDLTKLKNLLRE